MTTLKRAHNELFRRLPDERFASLSDLWQHCEYEKERSQDRWELPERLVPTSDMTLCIGSDPDFQLNDWSFTQLCRISGISKDTINRLSHKTASRALRETLPSGEKPLQLLTTGSTVRSIHGVTYTRLWNADLLSLIQEFATDFQAPQEAMNGGTGLYCGEQDMFSFVIDPTGWTEIEGEAFAPGFFLWNSEVGRRSVGIQTFWFQSVCGNHLVWDPVEIVEFSRKHTANVHEALAEIRRIIESLVKKRNARRDGFAEAIRNAMTTRLGTDADDVMKTLSKNGIPRNLARDAIEIAREQGAFTIFALVDALTRLTQRLECAGDRIEADLKAASLLKMAV